jgi:cytochrome P450
MPHSYAASLTARLKRELPPTAPLPVILQTLACRWWPFAYPEHCRARYGDSFTIYPTGKPPFVFLSDPRDIRAILAAPPHVLHPGKGSKVLAPLVGESSFLLAEEDQHMHGRKTIIPAFHPKMVHEQTELAIQIAQSEIASWPLGTPFPAYPHIQALILKVLLRIIFSRESHTLRQLHTRLLDMLSITASLVLQEPRLRYLPGWSAKWRRFIKQRTEVNTLIFNLIDRRRHEDNDMHGDLLDMLLAAHNPDGSPMSDRQVHDNLLSMILAGHETTASELAWAFQLLAHNLPVQERLIEEIDGDTDDQYLTATVQETMRHKPVFLFTIPRVVVEPVEIGSWTYHPSTHLLGCTYLMHHNPELYPDPHAFRPERFLSTTPQAGTWLPWGAGRKRCPGRHFALLQTQTVLREVLTTRLVLPASARIEYPRWRSAIITPHAGSRIVLHKRHRNG